MQLIDSVSARRVAPFAMLGSALLLLGMRPAAPALGAEPPAAAAERILFVSNRDGAKQFAIYAMNPDGTEQARVGKLPGISYDPVWSSDRARILFCHIADPATHKSTIEVMKADGSDVHTLLASEEGIYFGGPSWSQDGKHLVYSAIKPAGKVSATLYVADQDGKNSKKVGEGACPVWLPDSKGLIYSATSGAGVPPIWTVNLDGTNAKTLPVVGLAGSYSGDGKHIAFTTDHNNAPAIAVMDADFTHSTVVVKDGNSGSIGPVWTPDGKHILYTRMPKQDNGDGSTEVWSVNADGTNPHALTKAGSLVGPGTAILILVRQAGQ